MTELTDQKPERLIPLVVGILTLVRGPEISHSLKPVFTEADRQLSEVSQKIMRSGS
jgi:hypothetical protein